MRSKVSCRTSAGLRDRQARLNWVDHEPWVTRSSRCGSDSADRGGRRPEVRAPWASPPRAGRPLRAPRRPGTTLPAPSTLQGSEPWRRRGGRPARQRGSGNTPGRRGPHRHDGNVRSIAPRARPPPHRRTTRSAAPGQRGKRPGRALRREALGGTSRRNYRTPWSPSQHPPAVRELIGGIGVSSPP